MTDYYVRETCRLCDSTRMRPVMSFANTPPGNHFVSEEDLGIEQKSYPLRVNFCDNCAHLQLSVVVDPKILYQKKYSYVSATSPIFVEHLCNYAHIMVDKFNLSHRSLVIDIGSNDGTTLSFFKRAGCKVLGIDPAIEIVQRANANGIETLCDFFNLGIAEKNVDQYGKANLITSHNACAHIDDLQNVIKGVKHWLADDGIFIMEVGYLLDVYKNGWFDTIYHEHLDYHSVAPLIPFFTQMGMEVIDVEWVKPQGGSIRVFVQKKNGPFPIQESVMRFVNLEKKEGLHDAETFTKFNERIGRSKQSLQTVLQKIKQQGKTIAGYGAPTKATTLLSHFELGDVLSFIVEDNKLKQGLYTPKYHIPVLSADALYEKKPDYLLILAWNFAENIMERHRAYRSSGGKFIVPLPEAKILD